MQRLARHDEALLEARHGVGVCSQLVGLAADTTASQLAEASMDGVIVLNLLHVAAELLGEVLRDTGKDADAVSWYALSATVLHKILDLTHDADSTTLADRAAKHPEKMRRLTSTLTNLGLCQLASGDVPSALASCEESVRVVWQVAGDDWHRDLSAVSGAWLQRHAPVEAFFSAFRALSHVRWEMGEVVGAVDILEMNAAARRAICDRLIESGVNATPRQRRRATRHHGVTLYDLARMYRAVGHPDLAMETVRAAIEAFRQLVGLPLNATADEVAEGVKRNRRDMKNLALNLDLLCKASEAVGDEGVHAATCQKLELVQSTLAR